MMAKTKEQKQLEAKFRNVRGDLVSAIRNNDDTKERIDDGSIFFNKEFYTKEVEEIVSLYKEYQKFPKELTATGFVGWVGVDNWLNRLRKNFGE